MSTTREHPPAIAGPGAVLVDENVRERHFPVDSNFDGWRLDKFLSMRLARLSRTKANEIIKHGDIEVTPGSRKPKPSMKLSTGQTVTLREHLAPEWIQDAQVERLYEDADLIVLNKPAGMLVHESASVRLNTIQLYLERQREEEAEPVHRLDRETSGVLICARTRERVPQLRELFASEHPDKVYRAMVLDPDEVFQPGDRRTITAPLGASVGEELDLRMTHGDLTATTHVEALRVVEHARFGRMVDMRVVIETGRQHQIRVHLEMQGTPIAGDKLYGQTDAFFMATCDRPDDPALLAQLAYPRHALHAWKLTMPHPGGKRKVTFTAPLPEEIWGDEGS